MRQGLERTVHETRSRAGSRSIENDRNPHARHCCSPVFALGHTPHTIKPLPPADPFRRSHADASCARAGTTHALAL